MRRSKANAHGPARTEIVVDMGTGLRGDDTILIAAVENPARTRRQIARQPATAAESMIDRIVAAIPDADNDFVLMFSSVAFAGHQFRLIGGAATGRQRYYASDLGLEGWLCPVLPRNFSRAPKTICVQVRGANLTQDEVPASRTDTEEASSSPVELEESIPTRHFPLIACITRVADFGRHRDGRSRDDAVGQAGLGF